MLAFISLSTSPLLAPPLAVPLGYVLLSWEPTDLTAVVGGAPHWGWGSLGYRWQMNPLTVLGRFAAEMPVPLAASCSTAAPAMQHLGPAWPPPPTKHCVCHMLCGTPSPVTPACPRVPLLLQVLRGVTTAKEVLYWTLIVGFPCAGWLVLFPSIIYLKFSGCGAAAIMPFGLCCRSPSDPGPCKPWLAWKSDSCCRAQCEAAGLSLLLTATSLQPLQLTARCPPHSSAAGPPSCAGRQWLASSAAPPASCAWGATRQPWPTRCCRCEGWGWPGRVTKQG